MARSVLQPRHVPENLKRTADAYADLVRLEGRLAKSPSFWIKNVDIVRTYARIHGVIVPVALESTAQVRFHGDARLRMTYVYMEIDGRPVRSDD
jgi:hypothetical protein